MENKNKNTSNKTSISSKILKGLFIILTIISGLFFIGVLVYNLILYINTGNFTFNFWKTLLWCLKLYGIWVVACLMILAFRFIKNKLFNKFRSSSIGRKPNKKLKRRRF